jgi:hypothetical protein
VSNPGGPNEFIGRVGTVVAHESGMFRFKLLVSVDVPGAGEVKNLLWKRRFRLFAIRTGEPVKHGEGKGRRPGAPWRRSLIADGG